MTTRSEMQQQKSKGNAWCTFVSEHGAWLSSWQGNQTDTTDVNGSSDERQSDQLISYMLAALAASPERLTSKAKDLEVMKKAMASIYDAMNEDILSEDEASELIDFLAGKFVERRFGNILTNVLNFETSRRYTFRVFTGKSNERREETKQVFER